MAIIHTYTYRYRSYYYRSGRPRAENVAFYRVTGRMYMQGKQTGEGPINSAMPPPPAHLHIWEFDAVLFSELGDLDRSNR